jgi:hypothetical protein
MDKKRFSKQSTAALCLMLSAAMIFCLAPAFAAGTEDVPSQTKPKAVGVAPGDSVPRTTPPKTDAQKPAGTEAQKKSGPKGVGAIAESAGSGASTGGNAKLKKAAYIGAAVAGVAALALGSGGGGGGGGGSTSNHP